MKFTGTHVWMNGATATRLLVVVLFRLVHWVLLLESDLYALIKRLLRPEQTLIEVFNLVGRFRIDETDAARDSDFLIFHDYFTNFDEICESYWSVYHITESYVYLVKHENRGPADDENEKNKENAEPSIEKCSKLTRYLFNNAEKVARIKFDDFAKLARALPPFRARVVMIHSTPCGGGTVAAKLLQSCDRSQRSLLVLGEPPALTSLALLLNVCSIERMRAITQATMRFCLLHQKPNQTVVLKARPCCTKLVPYVHSTCPSVHHVFISTRSPVDVITRLVLHTSLQMPVFSMTCWMMKNWPLLCDTFFSWRQLEAETVVKIGPTTEVEFALAQVMGATINYQRNLKYYALDMVYVEDLMRETASVIRPLLNVCDVSDLAIPECIEWKRSEENVLRNVWDSFPLEEHDRLRTKLLVEFLQQECLQS
ncbi:unnamed protein product [Caenorhabditis auriculariae]|uniref:Sulfotransferase domain-containing protein n=1 Tax=Caenorhabditis auriculariae TaxID=2777116 RepID=A0A8S1HIP7_9PELO|nr:unnamed protein product [Caenorhabditis auriculariae]